MHKIQIRKSVFETNSSSSHSLTLGKGDLAAQPLPPHILREGVICLSAGEYGWEWHRYYSVQGKLRYLLTQVTNGQVPDDIEELCQDNERVAMLRDVVKEHTGCSIIVTHSSGHIDHQSAMGDGNNGVELFNSAEALKSFIFDPESYIETGNDNSSPPWQINTDRGYELYYGASIKEVPKSYRPMELTPSSRYGDSGYLTPNGALLTSNFNAHLYEKLVKTGIVSKVVWEGKTAFDPFQYDDVRGSTASRITRGGDDGLKLAPNFEAISRIQKVAYDHNNPDDDRERPVMTVMLSPALVKELKALPATAEVLFKLAHAKLQLSRLTKAMAERGESYLAKAKQKTEEGIAELEAQAKAQGLL
jgi:hypothetical protein